MQLSLKWLGLDISPTLPSASLPYSSAPTTIEKEATKSQLTRTPNARTEVDECGLRSGTSLTKAQHGFFGRLVRGSEWDSSSHEPTWGGADLGTGAEQDNGGDGGDLWTEAGQASSNRWADSGVRREILEVQASGILCGAGARGSRIHGGRG